MKNLQKFTIALVLLFSVSLFAQRSTFWDGTYKMDYGNQTMKIVTDGGSYYKAYFSGDCNVNTTIDGKADGYSLIFPMTGGNKGDHIKITKNGNKLEVYVQGDKTIRKICDGATLEGTYSSSYRSNHYSGYNENYNHKRYNSDNFNNSYSTRDSRKYNGHAEVHDLMKISAPLAYERLQDRGFVNVKTVKGQDKLYKIWYNNETNQCIKTVSLHKHIHDILKSTHCH